MGNFSFKNFGFTLFMSEMRAILKPELPIYIVNCWRRAHFLAVVTSLAM